VPQCVDRGGVLGVLLKAVKLACKPPRAGARAVVRAADLPGVTGRYFNVARDVPLKPAAADRALAAGCGRRPPSSPGSRAGSHQRTAPASPEHTPGHVCTRRSPEQAPDAARLAPDVT
jgi:hypothetical protein